MTAVHRPDADLLLDYATGRLPEPLSLLVATHLTLCPRSREDVAAFEAVGGAILEDVPPEPVTESTRAAMMASLDMAPLPETVAPASAPPDGPLLPSPLRDYVAGPLTELPWRRYGSALKEFRLLTEHASYRTRLMLITAGKAMPRHTHGGQELTLVLSGAFSDHLGHYKRGDVACADPSVDHSPVADAGADCLCLAVSDAPVRLTGHVSRLLNPLVDF